MLTLLCDLVENHDNADKKTLGAQADSMSHAQ